MSDPRPPDSRLEARVTIHPRGALLPCKKKKKKHLLNRNGKTCMHVVSRCVGSVKVAVSVPLLVEEVVIHRLREQGD